jgi:hypothetical protein
MGEEITNILSKVGVQTSLGPQIEISWAHSAKILKYRKSSHTYPTRKAAG